MFDSVLQNQSQGRNRVAGTVVSVLVHGGLLALALYISTRPKHTDDKPVGVPVAFIAKAASAAPPPPPPPPPPASHKPRTHPKPVVKPTPLVIPKEIPKEKPPEKPPEPEEKKPPEPEEDDSSDDDNGGQEGGVEGGVKGGVVGGVKGGVVGGVVGGQLGGQLGGEEGVLFGEGMTKPIIDPEDMPQFRWPKDALEAKVEGLILAQCSVSSAGTLRDCKILKRLPHIEDAVVLGWLAEWKMKPATSGGKPVALKNYTIPIRLKIPTR